MNDNTKEEKSGRGCWLSILITIIYFIIFSYPSFKTDDGFGVYFRHFVEAILSMTITVLVVFCIYLYKESRKKKKSKKEILSSDNLPTTSTQPNHNNSYGITKEYFDEFTTAAQKLKDFYDELSQDQSITELLDIIEVDYDDKLFITLTSDIYKNYQKLGHTNDSLKNKEGMAITYLFAMLLDYFTIKLITYEHLERLDRLSDPMEKIARMIHKAFLDHPEDDFFFLSELLEEAGRRDLKVKYLTLMYRFVSIIAKADNTITDQEESWLKSLMSFTNRVAYSAGMTFDMDTSVIPIETTPPSTRISEPTDPMAKLNSLIGLSNVKIEINNLSNVIKIQKMRESRGMKTTKFSYHCVFTGNPGTGKTTVARIVAEIYKQIGVLKRGHLIETDRSGLVADYVGQTATKTNAIINSALDGVLFIDEAYSLIQGGDEDFGREAISTLLKRMEDDRDRLVVILAGYTKEMKSFIDSNSGLQSRFSRYIEFQDYTSDELIQIFDSILKGNDFVITDEAHYRVKELVDDAVLTKDQNFGNARFIRNLFEKIITQQANRLTSEPHITNELLSTIELSDVENVQV